jgi:hypothetical protein
MKAQFIAGPFPLFSGSPAKRTSLATFIILSRCMLIADELGGCPVRALRDWLYCNPEFPDSVAAARLEVPVA